MNRIKNLTLDDGPPGIGSVSVTRFSALSPIPTGTGGWLAYANRADTIVNTFQTLFWGIDPPDGSVITGWTLYLVGAPAHANLPANKTRGTLYKVNSAASSSSIGSTVQDPSGNTTAYQLDHTISLTGLSEVVDKVNYRYQIGVESEYGANALAGLSITAVSYTVTVTKLDIC